MLSRSNNLSGSAAAPMPRSGAVGSGVAASRLVIRDESTDKKPLASDESSAKEIDTDYESEIFRLERRGGQGVLVAHPKPLQSANARIAHIDWCAFTIKPPQFKTHHWIMSELGRLFGLD